MFKSVFSRFIIAFTLIFVISFSFLIVIIRVLVKDYSEQITAERIESAEEVASSAKGMIEDLFGDYLNHSDLGQNIPGLDSVLDSDSNVVPNPNEKISFKTYLESEKEKSNLVNAFKGGYSLYNDLIILVTDYEGKIHIISGPHENANETELPLDLGDEMRGVMDSVHSNKGTYYSITGNLDDFFDAEHDIVAVRLATEPAGAVFVCSPHEDFENVYQEIVTTTVVVGLLVMAAGVIVIIFLSQQIRAPLRNMERAARSFAKGDFTVRVPETGGGEIAELAVVFNNMAASLAELEEQRSSFLANVSHDLRTPMTTISGFIDGILDGVIPEEKHPYYLAIVREEVGRLSRLVRTLLELSRIQAGDRKFNFVTIDVQKMAWQILVSNEKRINEKQLEVDFDADDEAMYVLADSDAIHQVLYNLIDNAIKFSYEKGVLRIQLKNEGNSVRLTIYNEGNGVSAQDLAKLFDRFYKADKSRGLDKTGTGLGLNIARVIVVAHGDDIKVESEEGKYCSFTFCLKRRTKEQYIAEHTGESKKKDD